MVGLLALMIFIVFFELPGLLNKKQYREMAAFLIICVIAAAYGSLYLLDIPLPSPFEVITKTVSNVMKYIR